MKRFILVLTLALTIVMPLFAEKVAPEIAQSVATTFLSNNGTKASQLTDLSKAAGFPNLYIFAAEQGFVVMSADDCVQPILGYSFTEKFVAEDMPDNVRGWLQGYNNKIQYAIDNSMRATSETTKLWRDLSESKGNVAKANVVVAPLIQTKWNQSKYYNSLCPAASGGPEGHAYTGCVATAMAQIMKYWEYPSHGIGSHSYTWNNQTLSVDFNATIYDWNNMVNYYNYYYNDQGNATWLSAPSSEQLTAVATLMYHCGVSVDMNYGGGGSSASTYDVMAALQNYFNYVSSMHYEDKADYTDSVWIAMVKAELDERRPLQYRGSGSGGHSFVCDGYNSDDYFHFNWGWSGRYNGYFSVDNLDTGANNESGSGNGYYTDDQAAIFGIQPVRCAASDPTNLTYNISNLQDLTLNWNTATGAASYNIYRNGNFVGNVTTNSYSETAPFGSNVYYVRCVDADGNLSLSSNMVTVFVGYQTPIVNDLTATLSGNTASLSWTAPDWCYPERPSETLNYGNGSLYYSWTSVYYAHRHLATALAQYAGKAVYKVSTFIEYPGKYSLYVYTKSTSSNQPDPSSLAANFNQVTVSLSNDWFEFILDAPIILTGTDDLWVVIKQEDTGQRFAVPSFNLSEHNINAFYSGSSPTSLRDAGSSYNCAWFINTYLTDGTYTYNLYDGTSAVASNLADTSYSIANVTGNTLHQYTVKTNYYAGETNASNKASIAMGTHALGDLNLENDRMIVTENSSLTVRGTLACSDPEHLIIENGAQLINDSEGVSATIKKALRPSTEGQNDGWNLIASPVIESLNVETDLEGLLENDYDLYLFDQSGTDENGNEKAWRNYKANAFSTIDHKVGYLYANCDETTLSFVGTLAGAVEDTELDLDPNSDFAGFNLIGNPYPCNTYLSRPFYVLEYDAEEDITSFVLGNNDNPIAPCSAILVQAQTNEESVSFSKEPLPAESKIAVRLSQPDQKSANAIDQVHITFQQRFQLDKYPQTSLASLYIPQEGKKLAVVDANGQTEMPLNLKTSQNGTYMLSFETENLDTDYLHLIDNMTGADVDLLSTPSYTFEANVNDHAWRFKLVFSNGEDAVDGNETFAYISNGEIMVNGEGTLQVIEMTGRVVIFGDAMNRVSTREMTPGVYVLRLITKDDMKTQKIVIE